MDEEAFLIPITTSYFNIYVYEILYLFSKESGSTFYIFNIYFLKNILISNNWIIFN